MWDERISINKAVILAIMAIVSSLLGNRCDFRKESEVAMTDESKTIIELLNCDYELIPFKKNQTQILSHFDALAKQGIAEGFYPLIIMPSVTIAEALEYFKENNDIENTPESIEKARQTVIEKANEIDAKALLAAQLNEELDDNNSIIGQFVRARPQNDLSLDTLGIEPYEEIIIAKIPTKNPWELAAWIPMGGFNECPVPEEQVAVFRHWFEKYGAVPAVVSYDTWQMTLAKPPLSDEEAEALAKEQFAFCPDIVFQGTDTIRALASTVKNSPAWFFWWD